jgi:hypothetical protein
MQDLSLWIAEESQGDQNPYFAPDTWRSLWNTGNSSNTIANSTIYGTLDVETLNAVYKLDEIQTRAIQGITPFNPSIGLAPLDYDSVPSIKDSRKSLMYHLKKAAKLNSTSWSFADSQPFPCKSNLSL